jgi:fatty-acyl-CoA synthase
MAPYDYQLTLNHVLTSGVKWVPDQEIFYRDKFSYTYKDMYQRVLHLAGALQKAGVKPGARVGVIEWDSHRYLEMYFAIPGIGAVLHTINPRLAPKDVGYIINHAEDDILIFHEDFLPLVEKLQPSMSTVRKFILIRDQGQIPSTDLKWADFEDFLHSASPLSQLPDLDEETQATQAYTTGTTGKPKGVYFNHRQMVLHTLSVGFALSGFTDFGGITKRDVYMPLTPLFHVHGWGIPYVSTMLGLRQIYPGRYEPEMLLKLIVSHKVTFSHCVPTILQMITGAPQARQFDLSRWKVIIGGARLPKGLAREANELGIKVYSGYGMSETAPVLTLAYLKPYMENLEEDDELDVLVKTGVPIPMVDLRVVNMQGQEIAHDGKEKGEIKVRSPWLTPGYYKDPALSEQLWEGGWLNTADVASVDAHGYVQIVDRLKDMIKSGGEWISSLELENLLSLHEGVQDAAVIGVPDEKWGERPMAIIVLRDEYKDKVDADGLKMYLTRHAEEGSIADYAIPDYFEFADQLPKTSVGKIDKKELRGTFIRVDPAQEAAD